MTTTTIQGAQTGTDWETALEEHYGIVEQELPTRMRPYLRDTIARLDKAFPREGQVSPNEVDRRVIQLNDAIPSPLKGNIPGNTLASIHSFVEVMIAEIVDLRDRVAILEGKQEATA